ncbi:MAG: hypothetical protein GY784_01670 [Gammaproteobacteria bacterium]|nr:hypothetical protein [Gammaproteobacteria bacterium]
MGISKAGLRVCLASALILVVSLSGTARAHHDHSILPYVMFGVFASTLYHNSHSSHSYRYTAKRRHIRHGHGYGKHYAPGYQHSHSQGGYVYRKKRH